MTRPLGAEMRPSDYEALLRGRVRNWVEKGQFATIRDLSSAAWNQNVDRGYGLGEEVVAKLVSEEVKRWAKRVH